MQARCVVATAVLPYFCRVGRALLHLKGTWGGGRVHRQLRICRPELYCPSGECLLSKPSPDLPWHYTVLRAYKSPEGRGDGKGGMDQPVQGPGMATKGMLGGTPAPAGSWFQD